MKQFFKKSLLEFVALSTTIHSSPVAYIHLDTVLLIFIVLYLCFSSVSACLMQRLSFSLSEIKTYWKTLGLFSVSMSFWMTHTSYFFHKTPPSCIYCKRQECVCVFVWWVWMHTGRHWHGRLTCQEQVEGECEQWGEATVEAGNTHNRCALHMWSHDAYKAD